MNHFAMCPRVCVCVRVRVHVCGYRLDGGFLCERGSQKGSGKGPREGVSDTRSRREFYHVASRVRVRTCACACARGCG